MKHYFRLLYYLSLLKQLHQTRVCISVKECSNEWSCIGSCWNEKNEKSDLMERDDETDLVSQQQSSFNTRLHKRLVKPNHVSTHYKYNLTIF